MRSATGRSAPGTRRRAAAWLAAVLAAAALQPRARSAERVETFGRDEVELTVRASPGTIALDRELHLTLHLRHPDGLEVRLPTSFHDRLEGFSLIGQYEDEPVVAGAQRLRVLHLRARPLPGAGRYRLAPLAVRWTDPQDSTRERWFPTRALHFATTPLIGPEEDSPSDIEVDVDARWVRPSVREFGLVAALLTAVALVLALVGWGILRLVRRIRLARLAPRERALRELDELLRRNLHGRGRYKRFYIELTHVVRRYIERCHAIRAPELTTGEFLLEAGRHPSFPPATLERLHEFLEAADRIKFAGVEATPEQADVSIRTAREYLESEPRAELRARDTRENRNDA